jgi:hypothetical protein
MKIAHFKTKDKKFDVAWLLFTPPTFRLLHSGATPQLDAKGLALNATVFEDAAGVLPDKSGLVVECRLLIDGVNAGVGFTSCSTKDEFDLGKGLKGSLDHAIADLRDTVSTHVDTTDLWKALFADGLIGPVLRSEWGSSWPASPLGKELKRRFETVTRLYDEPSW